MHMSHAKRLSQIVDLTEGLAVISVR